MGKISGAPAKQASAELLNLAAMVMQLRGAQAAPAKVEGELRPVPAVAPLETPLPHFQLEPLLRALTESGNGRERVLEDAVERDAVCDLRLLRPAVDALDNSSLGGTLGEQVLPKFGAAAVPLLLATLKIDGGAADARRLDCLAKIQGREAEPLLRRAVAEGSTTVRAAAFRIWGEMNPQAVEPLAVSALASDKSQEVRAAAASVLGSATSDAALEALLKALSGSEEVRRFAAAALATLPHPDTTPCLLALLTPEALDLREPVQKAAKSKNAVKLTPAQHKAKQKEEQAAWRRFNEAASFAHAVIGALGRRCDPRAEAKLLDLWQHHKLLFVREAASEALINSNDPAVREALEAALESKEHGLRAIAVRALMHDKARLFDRAAKYFDPATLARKGGDAAAGTILTEILERSEGDLDPRWGERCLALVDDKRLRHLALGMIGMLRYAPAVEPLLERLQKEKDVTHEILEALKLIGDKRAALPIASLLEGKGGRSDVYAAINALRRIDDPVVLPIVRAFVNRVRSKNGWEVSLATELIEWLERDRTLS